MNAIGEHWMLVGTYRFGDGTVRTAADEHLTEQDAADAYARMAADEQFVPHTRHTAEILTRSAYDARYGLLPPGEQDYGKRFDGSASEYRGGVA